MKRLLSKTHKSRDGIAIKTPVSFPIALDVDMTIDKERAIASSPEITIRKNEKKNIIEMKISSINMKIKKKGIGISGIIQTENLKIYHCIT